jgi:serine protease inhibitor
MKINISYLLISLFLLSSCKKAEDVTTNKGTNIAPIELAAGGDLVTASSNDFGFDIFNRIVAGAPTNQNVFISPISISLALAMTLNGARNATADSMEYALRLPDLTTNEINAVYKSLIDGLTTVDEKVLLKIANSIWYKQDFVVEQDFISVNQNFYNSKVEGLDFGNPSSKDIINGWVEDNTNGKIKNLIDRIDPLDIMYLINAIYFKGVWHTNFDKEETVEAPFYCPDGSQKLVPLMKLKDTLNYYSNDLFDAVELDYGRGNYSMVVLLPKTGKSTGDVVKELSTENWTLWTNGFHKTEIRLLMPRFKFEYEIELNDILTDMGMGIAFTGDSDFTGINPAVGLEISYVKHKSFIEVNETGTEAAAATVVDIRMTAMLENIININHPFIFAIREKSTGALVFMGRVINP